MNIGPSGMGADWSNVLAGAAHFGFNQEKAVAVIQQMASKVNCWRELFSKEGVSEQDTVKFEGSLDSILKDTAWLLNHHGAITV